MDDPRAELADLTRDLAALLKWQRACGTTGLPVGRDASAQTPVERERRREVAPRGPDAPTIPDSPKAIDELRAQLGMEPPPRVLAGQRGLFGGADVDSNPTPATNATSATNAVTGTNARNDADGRPTLVDMTPTQRKHALDILRDEIKSCTRCRLHEGRTQTVFSRGNPMARLAFVGEGPGRDEDRIGAPFVGAAGQLLDKVISAMGLSEEQVYICNVVKCRPPENRTPLPDEMATCGPYLSKQLANARPELIVALGKTSASYLLRTTAPMAAMRGKWHEWESIPVLVTWHPAYLLRQPSAKRDTWDDMKTVLRRLGLAVPAR